MITLYTAGTSNGHRAAIALEESGLPYAARILDLRAGAQRNPEYLAINPAGQIPAIVDPDGDAGKPAIITQSAAILLYVARKSGTLLPKTALGEAQALQWVLQAVTDCGPSSSAVFFCSSAGPAPADLASEFFRQRLMSYFAVCNIHLAEREYLCGDYSVADIALYPIVAARAPFIADDPAYAHLNRWRGQISVRPAVQCGIGACTA